MLVSVPCDSCWGRMGTHTFLCFDFSKTEAGACGPRATICYSSVSVRDVPRGKTAVHAVVCMHLVVWM